MTDLSKFNKFLGRPVPVTLTNADDASEVFYLKPLNIGQQAMFMEVIKSIQAHGEMEVEVEEEGIKTTKKVPNISKEDMQGMFDVILDVVMNSYPELDLDTAKDFCNTNFEQLSNALSKLTPGNKSNKDLDSLKQAQEAIKRGKSE